MIKQFFSQDKVTTALVASVGLMALCTVLLAVGLALAGEPVEGRLRWFAAVFVPLLLLLRYYIGKQRSVATKTVIIVLFVTFVAFMFLLFHTHSLTLK